MCSVLRWCDACEYEQTRSLGRPEQEQEQQEQEQASCFKRGGKEKIKNEQKAKSIWFGD